ncbi:hypothetical protein A9Q98_14135 [Thalassotalea sp. 42_200_T64]|nr:hypothetical protein A9Q98_14135 [Thalassotalea sp. 42_200_T64]
MIRLFLLLLLTNFDAIASDEDILSFDKTYEIAKKSSTDQLRFYGYIRSETMNDGKSWAYFIYRNEEHSIEDTRKEAIHLFGKQSESYNLNLIDCFNKELLIIGTFYKESPYITIEKLEDILVYHEGGFIKSCVNKIFRD